LPANSQEIGSDMLSNLVRKALFREDEFASALALAPFRSFPAWQSSLSTWDKDFRGLRLSEIHQVYQRFFRPENVTVVIAGAFPAGEATKAFTERFEDWRPVTVRRVYETKPQELYKSHPTPTVGLWADMTGVPYPHLELASIALGLGKHGAAFRIIRNQLGLSYRQEGVIAPGPGGLRLGVVYQRSSSEGAESALAAIAKDIETWNQATLDRARATISALDALGMSYSSVYLDPSSPIAGTNADRAYWSAYATTNSLPKDRKAVLGAMATVSLEQLKILAKRWASEAKIEITR
ncbi:MAG: insulinase family protein, partial [Fimbriimonadaceae bacterium]